MNKCQNCKYWISYKGSDTKGMCRRWAPEVIPQFSGGGLATFLFVGSDKPKSAWPETAFDDWCGEHDPRTPPVKKPDGE